MDDEDRAFATRVWLFFGGSCGWFALTLWLWGFAAAGGRVAPEWIPLVGITTVPFVVMFCWALREVWREH
jgi:hypothetical protein